MSEPKIEIPHFKTNEDRLKSNIESARKNGTLPNFISQALDRYEKRTPFLGKYIQRCMDEKEEPEEKEKVFENAYIALETQRKLTRVETPHVSAKSVYLAVGLDDLYVHGAGETKRRHSTQEVIDRIRETEPDVADFVDMQANEMKNPEDAYTLAETVFAVIDAMDTARREEKGEHEPEE